ncbi:hypothetical protein [Nonomuraea sp. NPDC003709]|uniref:hypothetical protein n=1 Tax=Nonomuraea sp. NPDC003709 TaxID=3154450 RepID=UPI0033B2348B
MTDGTSARLGSVRTLRPELVGRTGELARIQEAVVDGYGLVLIDGEPGVGKTSDTARGRLDRFHAYRGIRALLSRGAVPALDDLHWADAPSLELTEFLLRHPPAAGFLPAIACRSTMIPPPVADGGPGAALALEETMLRTELDRLTPAGRPAAYAVRLPPRRHPLRTGGSASAPGGSPPRSAPCRPAHGEPTAPRSAPFWSARRDRGSGSRSPPSGRSSGGIRRPG